MKIRVLLIIFTFGFSISAFSQANPKNKIDFGIGSLPLFCHYVGHNGWTERNGLTAHKGLDSMSGFKEKNLSVTIEKEFAIDNMPCYKPEGIFSAQIVKPDTTTRYSMMIKKY